MNSDEPIYSSQQVAQAAGMTSPNLRAYITRGHWQITDQAKAADTAGKGHLFTLRDALGYALAYRLVLMGAPPKLAFELGMEDLAYLDEGMTGPLFRAQAEDAAWFVYYPWVERREAATYLVGPRRHVGAFFEKFGGETAVIIDLFALRDQVFRALGVEPEAA